jgi:hypothetical protein
MHILYEDMDGDGTKEVVSETNGTWNRVTVWDVNGTALATTGLEALPRVLHAG